MRSSASLRSRHSWNADGTRCRCCGSNPHSSPRGISLHPFRPPRHRRERLPLRRYWPWRPWGHAVPAIAPDLAGIRLICPTILYRYKAIDNVEMEAERKERMVSFRDGLRTGGTIADDEMVGYVNRSQFYRSMRYLYSAVDEFDWARDLLAQNPAMSEVTTHMHIGQMGRGPLPRAHMPGGLHLVMRRASRPLHVAHCRDGRCRRRHHGPDRPVHLLSQVARDPGMLTVDLYDDGHVIRHMGQGDDRVSRCNE